MSTGLATSAAASTPSPQASGNSLAALHLVNDHWYHHGFSVAIHADGSGSALWRTYRFCSQFRQPCDRLRGNDIIDGGHATFTVNVPPGASYGVAHVSSSTQPSVLAPHGTVTITPVRSGPYAGHEIIFPIRQDPKTRMCDPTALSSSRDCGA